MAVAAKQEEATSEKPDYGLDAPQIVRSMFSRGGWTLAVAIAMYVINHQEYPGPSARILAVLGLIAACFIGVGAVMVWSSRKAKLQLRDRLIDSVGLNGDEKVLDAGCGLGLLAIGAAKRLKAGRVTAIDVWNPKDLSGNSPEGARRNARIEGVGDRVRVENGDARKLTFPDASYDVVLSSLAIHNIPESEERDRAVREMWRVLKPGGRLAIFDILHTSRYAQVLREAGAAEVSEASEGFLWCLPSRRLLAKK